MTLNYLKIGSLWLLKAAVLVSLSLIVIFWLTPKADAATVLTGRLITDYGTPVLKLDDISIISFTDATVAQRFWTNVGNQVKVDCAVRNSTMFELKSVTVIDSGEKVWEDNGAVLGDQTGQGGGVIVKKLDKIQGRLIIRHTQPAVDITPELLYGSYSDVTLGNLDSSLTAELIKLTGGYGGDIVAEGELDGLVIFVDNLWINGVQRKQSGFIQ